MASWSIPSLDGKTNNTFRVFADHDSMVDLVATLNQAIITGHIVNRTVLGVPVQVHSCFEAALTTNATVELFDASLAHPENVWRYYRGSTAAISIDEYNNTDIWSATDIYGTQVTSLPSSVNISVLECFDTSIMRSIPLVGGGIRALEEGRVNLVIFALVWVSFYCMRSIV